MPEPKLFATEAELVERFCWLNHPDRWERNRSNAPKWTPYHETAGWDLLMVHESGVQLGIEAKLTLNAKVLEQALPTPHWHVQGPDYRAVLVPSDGLQHHLTVIAWHLGIVVIRVSASRGWRGDTWESWNAQPGLPSLDSAYHSQDWPAWYPGKRCTLPDYIPDVSGGKASPVTLTQWKVGAIKLLILLEKRGWVSRTDIEALDLSASRWTAAKDGYLDRGAGGVFIRGAYTPNFKAQHPRNWAEIEADFPNWGKGFDLRRQGGLI